jgi:hypothetical protein
MSSINNQNGGETEFAQMTLFIERGNGEIAPYIGNRCKFSGVVSDLFHYKQRM